DEYGVVLRATGQDLDGPSDLLVSSDDGIELALAGLLGEVSAVLLERLVLVFGVLAGDPVAATDVSEGGEQFLTGDAEAIGEGEQKVLGGQVLVGELRPCLVRG